MTAAPRYCKILYIGKLARPGKGERNMKKRWVFTGVAGLLGALFLGCVLWVGGASGWFGLGALAAGEEPAWEHAYPTTWDPAGRPVEDLLIQCGAAAPWRSAWGRALWSR